jgi:hypothetical protein
VCSFFHSGVWVDPEKEFILTTGQDQRINLWKVCFHKANQHTLTLSFVSACISEVADINSFATKSMLSWNERNKWIVVVGGEGLQIIELSFGQ